MPKYKLGKAMTVYLELTVEAVDRKEAFSKASDIKDDDWKIIESDGGHDIDIEEIEAVNQ